MDLQELIKLSSLLVQILKKSFDQSLFLLFLPPPPPHAVTDLYPSLDIERQLYRPALAPGFCGSRNNSLTASGGGGSLSSGENGGGAASGGGAGSRRTSGYSGQFIAGEGRMGTTEVRKYRRVAISLLIMYGTYKSLSVCLSVCSDLAPSPSLLDAHAH